MELKTERFETSGSLVYFINDKKIKKEDIQSIILVGDDYILFYWK